jgi:hypothetical protein
MKRIIQMATALSLAGLVGACGTPRTAAATQPTPAAFDPAKSDPKAVALADTVIGALGGEANWQKAKELMWFQAIIVDGKIADASYHSWDRWNGRHDYKRVDPAGKLGVSMYDMFGQSKGYAFVEDANGGHKSVSADKEAMIGEAKKRFGSDVYPFVLPFKLKDPGTHLKISEERPAEGSKAGSPMKFDVLEVTFDDGVGPGAKDTWYLVVDKETHLPESAEHHAGGKPDTERSGFTLEDWVEVGGLKFATVRKTLGYTKADAPTVAVEVKKEWKDSVPPDLAGFKAQNPGEIIVVKAIKVNAEPTEEEYVPDVNFQ